MKIAILSTATGQGHNAAALALKEHFEAMDCEVMLSDVLNMGGRHASDRTSNTYSFLTTHAPHLFYMLYSIGGLVDSPNRHSPVYYSNALRAKDVMEELKAFSPDAVFTTHMFGAHTMTYLAHEYGYAPPCIGVMTDYTPSPLWAETRCSSYIIPSPLLTETFVKSGLPAKKLLPFGIPVCGRFREKIGKTEAQMRMGLAPGPVFAVLGGSMGYGALKDICTALRALKPEAQVVAVCGRNKRAFDAVSAVPGVDARAYIDTVDVLMDAADVLLTKPGGLTTTEAINKGVPLLLTKPIPGCEEDNARFLTAQGLAVRENSASGAAAAAVRLLEGPEREKMIAAQKAFTQTDACAEIGALLANSTVR